MAQVALTLEEERDDLDEYIEEQAARNPAFPGLMEAAAQRKQLVRALAAARQDAGLSQTTVAGRMQTSTSVVARLEEGALGTTLVTVQRYAAAIGKRLEWRLADE